jgi:TolB protein
MRTIGMRAAVAAAALCAALLGPACARASFPGADGRIAFVSYRSADTPNVFSMNADGSDVRQLTFLTPADGIGAAYPAWSPDGRLIAFVHSDLDFTGGELWLMNADGSNPHVLLHQSPVFHDAYPTFSPDGTRVAFRRCLLDGEACAIFTVGLDGRDPMPVTHLHENELANVFDVGPKWSPDGTRIAFESFNRGGIEGSTYTATLDGTVTRVTPPRLEAVSPDWSPDGSQLVFSTGCCNAAPNTIWTVPAAGGRPHRVVRARGERLFQPVYSPAGDRIAIQRTTMDFSTNRIEVMNADGSGRTVIQDRAFSPAWGSATG